MNNSGVHVRVQICVILRRLGLPKDLRQLITKRVWFDCQSECLRRERTTTLMCCLSFIPLLKQSVHICDPDTDRIKSNGIYCYADPRVWVRQRLNLSYEILLANVQFNA